MSGPGGAWGEMKKQNKQIKKHTTQHKKSVTMTNVLINMVEKLGYYF